VLAVVMGVVALSCGESMNWMRRDDTEIS